MNLRERIAALSDEQFEVIALKIRCFGATPETALGEAIGADLTNIAFLTRREDHAEFRSD